jgi:hypothetical protein
VTFCRIDQFSSRLDTIKDDFKESRKKRGKIKKSHKNAADVKLVMTLYFSFLFSLTRIMMPYTPEYNIKWVLNVEIRFPAVIRDPFDRENGDLICAALRARQPKHQVLASAQASHNSYQSNQSRRVLCLMRVGLSPDLIHRRSLWKDKISKS